MDPVSLTAAVASLTFTCAKVIKCFHAIKCTYETAPVTIITMLAECSTVSASLNQIQSLVLGNPVALSSRMSPAGILTKNFDDALTGCMLTLSVIEDELEQMVEGDQGAGTVGFKAKAKFMWKETAMAVLLQQLRGQQAAIGLLVAVLQTESIAEVKEMVQKNTDTLQTMLQRARMLRGSQPTRPGASDASARSESIFSFGMSSTVAGLTPDLNSQLHQSSAYQRARAVEMEELWRQNHERLQEKYTLIEKIEQLEEEEKKTIKRERSLQEELEQHKEAAKHLHGELQDSNSKLKQEQGRSRDLKRRCHELVADTAKMQKALQEELEQHKEAANHFHRELQDSNNKLKQAQERSQDFERQRYELEADAVKIKNAFLQDLEHVVGKLQDSDNSLKQAQERSQDLERWCGELEANNAKRLSAFDFYAQITTKDHEDFVEATKELRQRILNGRKPQQEHQSPVATTPIDQLNDGKNIEARNVYPAAVRRESIPHRKKGSLPKTEQGIQTVNNAKKQPNRELEKERMQTQSLPRLGDLFRRSQ